MACGVGGMCDFEVLVAGFIEEENSKVAVVTKIMLIHAIHSALIE
jgi:hypothetical protein